MAIETILPSTLNCKEDRVGLKSRFIFRRAVMKRKMELAKDIFYPDCVPYKKKYEDCMSQKLSVFHINDEVLKPESSSKNVSVTELDEDWSFFDSLDNTEIASQPIVEEPESADNDTSIFCKDTDNSCIELSPELQVYIKTCSDKPIQPYPQRTTTGKELVLYKPRMVDLLTKEQMKIIDISQWDDEFIECGTNSDPKIDYNDSPSVCDTVSSDNDTEMDID